MLATGAAMLLFYDIAGDPADHDDWHSREHFAERLAVPGFLSAARWVSPDASPRYMVLYEVADVGIARSDAYLERLNNPSDWTSKIMPRFRGMIRGFCNTIAGEGFGYGTTAMAFRLTAQGARADAIAERLASRAIPGISECRGFVSCCLLKPQATPPMTREQSLRGTDKTLPLVLIVTGFGDLPEADLTALVKDAAGSALTEPPLTYRLDQIAGEREICIRCSC